ncbi:hypothetical protein CUR178_03672 [Leishmania enriettii]|uniref:Uncharacterized protein n=1 Tax=Leishmania enriettii TaxID=5663 RepID=A0A836KK67_LEIEN|nr:hypothetical protein CUR178_03672 [Leishmania enriettii]
MSDSDDGDDATTAAVQHRLRSAKSGEASEVASFAAVAATGESRLPAWSTDGAAAAANGSLSTAALPLPLELLAHRALAMHYFTAPERTLPGEGVFGRSPDLDSDKEDLLYRRGSRSLSGCSSGDSNEGCERDMRPAASWAALNAVCRDSLAPTATGVAASAARTGRIDSDAAAHVPLASTPPLTKLAGASLASPHLPSVNAIATARAMAPWAGLPAATTSLLASPPPHGLVTAAQVVWQADDIVAAHNQSGGDAAPSPPPLRFPTAVPNGAFLLASDAQCIVFSAAAAAAERMSTPPPASLQGVSYTQADTRWLVFSRIPSFEQGQWQSALRRGDRYRGLVPSPSRGVRATGEWEVEEQEEEVWEDNIFDEGGALHGAEVCLWLPRRAARCCFAAVLRLRHYLDRRGWCVVICPPLDSASDSEGYDSGRDTDDSARGEGEGRRCVSGGSGPLGGCPGSRAQVCRPLLSSSPTTHCVRWQLQRTGAARLPCFARDDDRWSSNSDWEEQETNDGASSPLSSLRVSPSAQLSPGATVAVRRRELEEGGDEGRGRRESASADSMVRSAPCWLLPCTIIASSLRRGGIACYHALSGTVAFYNVFASHRTSEMPTSEAAVHSAGSRHELAGSSPPPHLAEHTAAVASVSVTQTRRTSTNAHSIRQPLLLDIACVGRCFVLLQYVALVVLTATVLLLTVFSYRSRVAHVEDETACNCYSFEDRIRPDLSFSLICFLLNGVLATRYAVRAVRYERGGLLVVQVVVVGLQVCRAVYFLLVVARRYTRAPSVSSPSASFSRLLWPPMALDIHGSGADGSGCEGSSVDDYPPPPVEPVLALTWVGVVVSVSFFVAASALSPWVYASFGWRRYAQGIVQVSLSRVRKRLTVLRACVQLDGVITANAYLATVFLLESWPDQRTLLLMTLTIFALHYVLIPTLRRSRHWWPLLCAAGVLVTVSGYYAAVIGGALQKDHRLRSISSSPWDSVCYTDRLRECLYAISHAYPISIFRDTSAADSARSFRLSYKQSERARQQLPPAAARRSSLPMSATHSVLRLNGNRDTSVGSGATSPWFGCAVSSGSARPVQHVSNATDTYLPTYGAFPDYFRLQGCNATCFLAREESDNFFFERHIADCCAEYGQCRLKDDYRTYAVLLLFVLMIFSSAVRVVLLAVAWRRWVEGDDVVIELFVQEHCRRHHGGYRRRRRHPRQGHGHHHRRAAAAAVAGGGSGTPCPSPRRLRASHDATVPAMPLPSLSLQPTQNLAWDVEQYTLWRQQQCAAERAI